LEDPSGGVGLHIDSFDGIIELGPPWLFKKIYDKNLKQKITTIGRRKRERSIITNRTWGYRNITNIIAIICVFKP